MKNNVEYRRSVLISLSTKLHNRTNNKTLHRGPVTGCTYLYLSYFSNSLSKLFVEFPVPAGMVVSLLTAKEGWQPPEKVQPTVGLFLRPDSEQKEAPITAEGVASA